MDYIAPRPDALLQSLPGLAQDFHWIERGPPSKAVDQSYTEDHLSLQRNLLESSLFPGILQRGRESQHRRPRPFLQYFPDKSERFFAKPLRFLLMEEEAALFLLFLHNRKLSACK